MHAIFWGWVFTLFGFIVGWVVCAMMGKNDPPVLTEEVYSDDNLPALLRKQVE